MTTQEYWEELAENIKAIKAAMDSVEQIAWPNAELKRRAVAAARAASDGVHDLGRIVWEMYKEKK